MQDTFVSHINLNLQTFENVRRPRSICLENSSGIQGQHSPQEHLTAFMQMSYSPKKLKLHLIWYLQEFHLIVLFRGNEKIPKMSQVDRIKSVFNSNAPSRVFFKATLLHSISIPQNKS